MKDKVLSSLDLDSLSFRETPGPDDCLSVRKIIESTGFFNNEEIEVAVELVQERLTKGASSGYYFLFSEKAGEVIGYTCFGPIPCTQASFDLYWIGVREGFRSLGLGKELLAGSERIIAGLGGKRIYIETSSRTQYRPTRMFYQRCGYSEEAILKDFYAPGDHKVIYVKIIG
jgi:ribosomal protein S18 acetylase RimI-like enzyme